MITDQLASCCCNLLQFVSPALIFGSRSTSAVAIATVAVAATLAVQPWRYCLYIVVSYWFRCRFL